MMRGINHQNRRTSERRAKLAWAIPSEKEEDEVNIFEEQEDYYQFLTTLDVMAQSYEPDGTPGGRNYILYAYCLMSNHINYVDFCRDSTNLEWTLLVLTAPKVHLLIREREDTIGMSIKRIASSYVYYYNHKYSRDGHLFRERFKSEPVNPSFFG